jgi:hypothetical protein
MATKVDVQTTEKKTLTSMMMTDILGGSLKHAIAAQRASMDPQDVKEVEAELAELTKKS